MYAITGITGQVGGVVARVTLASGNDVRAVVRNADKAKNWATQGCEIAVADMNDVAALQNAFTGVDGVFILLPPTFDPTDGYPEARQTISIIRTALAAARPPKVVCLSTIGADATRPNLLNQLGILEQELSTLPMPIAFVRAAWFMENTAWDVAAATEHGMISSFLQPLDKPFPMVAVADVGRTAAELLQEEWTGRRVINLEGPCRISPNEIAESFANILGKPVKNEIVPRDTWHDLFTSQGMKNPTPRMQMLDGFNQGWIEFEQGEAGSCKGTITIDAVLKDLIEKASQ
jgi:uncharacterized protein YbjT (DUF2867 family)